MFRQIDQRTKFRAECHVLIGFRHDGWLAGDRIAKNAEAVLGADDKCEEAIEIVETFGQSFAEVHALVHARGDIGRGNLAVVLRFEGHAVAAKLAAQVVVVGKRTIMYEALIAAG